VFRPDVVPITLSQSQIDKIVADFATAAGRAAEAGFDGVEIHGAHFYLISQFLSPLTNQRDDRYGGNAGARATFALEIVRATRERLGKNYPILFRLNAVENVDGGQTRKDAVSVSRLLSDAGVDAIDVSLIAQSSWKEVKDRRYLAPSSAFPKKQPAGGNVEVTAEIKEATGLPVLAVGKLGEGDIAGTVVQDLPIDIVAIGRQMIADPHTASKILNGKKDMIVRCEECMACFASIGSAKPLACKVNKNLPGAAQSD
jgi:2,4-dienoyl-CoA reductase (NADPH2)